MSVSRFVVLYCSFALLLFGLLSYTAALQKSATFDEPAHVAAAFTHLRYGDFRANPEHPPLWKYWAALPLLLSNPPLNPNIDTPVFNNILRNLESQWPWSIGTIYQTPGNDPARILSPARFMMLLLGVALGAMIAVFAYRAGGPVAACAAVTLFVLDPNFLAHASLATNDVPLALATTALAYALWRAGRALTWPRLLSVALLCAACVTTKFTGLLAAPIVTLALLTRALMPVSWPVLGRPLSTRARRLGAAVAACVACALVTYAAIWAVYLFRFNPTPDPGLHFSTDRFLRMVAQGDLNARLSPGSLYFPTDAELSTWRPGPSVRAALFALDHHLLPEAFTDGLLYAHAASRFRWAYALGDLYAGGRWYYFPLAFLVKTPLTTLAVIFTSLLVLGASLMRLLRGTPGHSVSQRGVVPDPSTDPRPSVIDPLWLGTCLALPAFVFALSAVTAGMNIGLRHVFPIYPPLFVAAGIVASRLYSRRPRLVRPALVILGLALAVESVGSYPDYIPFFNAAAGGARGGYGLLGDSNLDWGQDLPLLAEWQRKHPDRALHLAYFGTADPAYYGIRYRNAPDGSPFAPDQTDTLPASGVLAVSASVLQRVAVPDPADHAYDAFRRRRPDEVLGGSIYLFDLDQ